MSFFKRLTALLLVGAMAVAASGCGIQLAQTDGTAPQSETHKGFFAPSDTDAQYGGDYFDGIYLQQMTATAERDQTVISLVMSEDAAGSQPLSMTPLFSVESLPSPARLIVWLEGIAAMSTPQITDANMAQSAFEVIMSTQQNRVGLVFALSSAAAYRILFQDSTLTIQLRDEGLTQADGWYITWYAINGYTQGTLPAYTQRLTPVLSADGHHKMLISRRFDTQDQAQAEMQSLQAQLGDAVADYFMEVVQLEAGQTPVYNPAADTAMVDGQDIVKINGQTAALPVVTRNGRFLCAGSDGTTRIYAVQAADQQYEHLYIQRQGGDLAPLITTDYYYLEQACFSPDMAYLAFIDSYDEETRIINLYNMSTGSTIAISEEGMGSALSGLTWSADSRSLVAIAGEDVFAGGSGYQLRAYQINPEGDNTVTALEERRCNQGWVVRGSDGYYFCQYEEEDCLLYRLDENSQRTQIAAAELIAADHTGRYVAYVAMQPVEEDYSFSLMLLDTQTGQTRQLTQDSTVVSMGFAPDADVLYYVADNGNEAYGMSIYAVDDLQNGMPQLVCDTYTSQVTAAGNGELFFSLYVEQSGVTQMVTYSLNTAE